MKVCHALGYIWGMARDHKPATLRNILLGDIRKGERVKLDFSSLETSVRRRIANALNVHDDLTVMLMTEGHVAVERRVDQHST
jgi:hypothetical protein